MKTDYINSAQSSLKSHPLWVTLYKVYIVTNHLIFNNCPMFFLPKNFSFFVLILRPMRPFIPPLAPRIPTTQFFSCLCTVFLCVLFVSKRNVFGFYECSNLFYIYLTFEARYCAEGKFAQTSV